MRLCSNGVVQLVIGVLSVASGFLVQVQSVVAVGLVLLAALILDAVILRALAPDVSGTLTRTIHPARPHAAAPVTVTTTGIPPEGLLSHGVDEDQVSVGVFPKRGLAELEAARIHFYSPLHAWRLVRTGQTPAPVIVAPQVSRVDTAGLVAFVSDAAGKLGLPREHLDDSQLREFATGDELRRVAWRASAKAGKLLTRALEPSKEHNVVLGVELGARPSEADEVVISLAASIIVALADEDDGGRDAELVIDGVTCPEGASAQLEALALIGAGDPDWASVGSVPTATLVQVTEHVCSFWYMSEVVWR